MKILITGVAGLFGANFSRYLLDSGYEVIGVDDLSGGYLDFVPIHKNFTFYELNILEARSLNTIFDQHKPDVVYHFAAYAAEGLSPFIRNFNYQNNLIASVNIINECVKYGSKLIFAETMAVYGDLTPPFTEDMPPKPIDPYGIAKYATELDIKQAGEQFGLEWSIIRPHNVIGKYQNIWDKYRNVAGIFIRRVLAGEPILIYGDGEQTRAFSDIIYYLDPLKQLMQKKFNGEVFNLGSDNYLSINDLADVVIRQGKALGYKNIRKEFVEARHEAKHAYCDHFKAKRLLDFKDGTDINRLIFDMFVWAKGQPPREVKKMEYELNKNIYSYWK